MMEKRKELTFEDMKGLLKRLAEAEERQVKYEIEKDAIDRTVRRLFCVGTFLDGDMGDPQIYIPISGLENGKHEIRLGSWLIKMSGELQRLLHWEVAR